MQNTITLIPCLLVLASCGSPPKPPTVDESLKRPANSQTAVELQVCRNDLQNTRLLATESGRLAQTTAATLANQAVRQQTLATLQARADQPVPANTIYTVRFEFGSSRVTLPADIAAPLIAQARTAPLVLLRGRTDGSADLPAEARIARDRATTVRDYLVAAGVDPARIRATYQPAGDPVADNVSATGRALNRRVEIEIYRVAPQALAAASDPANPTNPPNTANPAAAD
jgi:outer membrane protein OmpA-like peptidoglycan-associated protein